MLLLLLLMLQTRLSKAADMADRSCAWAFLELAALVEVLVQGFGGFHEVQVVDLVVKMLTNACRHLLQQNFLRDVVDGDARCEFFDELGKGGWTTTISGDTV